MQTSILFRKNFGFSTFFEKVFLRFSYKIFFSPSSSPKWCDGTLSSRKVITWPYWMINEKTVVNQLVTKLRCDFQTYSCAGYVGDAEHEASNVSYRTMVLIMWGWTEILWRWFYIHVPLIGYDVGMQTLENRNDVFMFWSLRVVFSKACQKFAAAVLLYCKQVKYFEWNQNIRKYWRMKFGFTWDLWTGVSYEILLLATISLLTVWSMISWRYLQTGHKVP